MTEETTTQRFIDALAALEHEHDLETMVELFASDSELGNVVSPRTFSGHEGAHAFWDAYRSTFAEVNSTFRNVIVGHGRAALEWSTTGSSGHGAPVHYDGVSILELADGHITRFWAYFDPGALGRQVEQQTHAG